MLCQFFYIFFFFFLFYFFLSISSVRDRFSASASRILIGSPYATRIQSSLRKLLSEVFFDPRKVWKSEMIEKVLAVETKIVIQFSSRLPDFSEENHIIGLYSKMKADEDRFQPIMSDSLQSMVSFFFESLKIELQFLLPTE